MGGNCVDKKLKPKKTLVISGFPGVGKSFVFSLLAGTNNRSANHYDKSFSSIMDSDSSKFDKEHFPNNYIKHIKSHIGKVDIIMVSSHKVVRDALLENNMPFTLVYPNNDLKDKYINNYIKRGNDNNFINFISKNWFDFLNELDSQNYCEKIKLKDNQYIKDLLPEFLFN